MASPKTAPGAQLLVQVGDGGAPETFAHDCLINAERGIEFSSDTNSFQVPDCDDPSKIPWNEIEVSALSATINGAGVAHTASVNSVWFAWLASGASKNCRVNVNVAAADGGGYFEGAFKCTQFSVTGNYGDKMQASVTLLSDGPVIWVDAV